MAITDHAAAEAHFKALGRDDHVDPDGRIWHGDIANCDVCSRPMVGETYMIDGRAEPGPQPRWGNLCVVCAYKFSPTIEWGKAQLYKWRDNAWHLIAGGPPPEDNHEY